MQHEADALHRIIDQGYVKSVKHPEADLWIYNYTPKTQYERYWNDITLACRGSVLDKDFNKIAVPFKKFFNWEEHQADHMPNLPNEPFEVFEKMDGSLGILYWLQDKPMICTRKSFDSKQALMASEWLHTRYQDAIPHLQKGRTYLFEIIYPENKVVVDYGSKTGLFLLGIIDNASEKDLPLEDIGFPIVNRFDGIQDIQQLKNLNTPNSEGFVLKFQSGFRVKVKFKEYFRLHTLITQFSNVSIWENLKSGNSFDQFLEGVPDEFYHWVKSIKEHLEAQYQAIETECKHVFKMFDTRKEAALYFKEQRYPNVLFSMLDHKDYSEQIWKLIRPTFERPYRNAFVE